MFRWLTPLRHALDERLQPPYLRLASLAALAIGLLLLVVSFATSDRGRTWFGPPLGPDFAGFHAAAQILEQGKANQLYDRELHDELYHALLPNLDKSQSIPYVHPPFVAAALRPCTWLPYETAFALWLVMCGGLYVGGLLLTWRTCPALPREHGALVFLLALTFEPFLLECWMGGQLSAVGFFSLALALYALTTERPFAAGLALGLCFYKPTFLLLFLPLLFWARQWRTLLGLTVTGLVLALLSILAVGLDVCLDYANVLLAFRKSTEGADGLEIRTWKFVDLSSSLRLLLGGPGGLQMVLFLLLALVPLFFLFRAWARWDGLTSQHGRLVWAAALTWTPVLNLYVGVYDSIVVVQAALLTADVLYREADEATPLRWSGLAYLLLLIGVTAWFTQALARTSGVQVYTVALAALGAYQLWLALRGNRPARFL